MRIDEKFLLLQLFGEGGEGGASSAGAEGSGETAVNAAQNEDLSKVVYGKQEEANQDAPDNNVENKEEDRNALYKKFKQDYKDLFDKEVQGIVKGRLKGAKDNQAKLDSYAPLLDMLKSKYHTDGDDAESLMKALEEDDDFLESEALAHGMDVETYRNVYKVQRQNEILQQKIEKQQQQEETNRIMQEMMQEAEALKTIYPNFDLNTELDNERFSNMFKVPGMDMRTAYEFVHKDEIMQSNVQQASQQAKEQVLSAVKANRDRVTEGASQSNGAVTTKSDPSNWTNEDLREVSKRVQNGAKIRL